MRFSSTAFSILTFVLTFSSFARADFDGQLQTTNIGCNIPNLNPVHGFTANIYSYAYNDLSDYTNTAFFNGGYSSSLITTVANVVDPNFINTAGYPGPTTSKLYGVDVPITNFAMELSGYFYGMYFSLNVFMKKIFFFVSVLGAAFFFLAYPFYVSLY